MVATNKVVVVPMAMGMGMASVLTVATIMEGAVAAMMHTHTVGAPDGLWDMHTDYAQWVKTKTFHPGDNLTFTYSPELHDVVEVTAAGYDACSSADNISVFRTGNDVVPLTAVGTRYFLCSLTGHCGNGMKICVDVVAPAAAPGPAPASSAAAARSPTAARLGSGLLVAAVVAAFW